jgi:hypothetical protein
MYKLIYLLLPLSLLLGGCQAPASPVPTIETATATPTQEPQEIRLTLEPCKIAGGTIAAECGYFVVPEDRAHPGGRNLELGIVVVRAQGPDSEPDPLFYIAGGPGDAATDVGNGAMSLFKEVNARRDVIFLTSAAPTTSTASRARIGFLIVSQRRGRVDEAVPVRFRRRPAFLHDSRGHARPG